jgi:hypothetical protein
MFAQFLLLADELDRPPLGEPVRGEKLKSISQVWTALAKLNGDRCSILIVAEGPPAPDSDIPYSGKALEVAGGKDGQYVCTAFINPEDDRAPTNARNPDVPVSYQDEVWLMRGELESFFSHRILGQEAVRAALEAFVKRGVLTDQLIWEDPDEE